MPSTKPLTCQLCALYTIGKGFGKSEGQGLSRVMMVGESLGGSEVVDSLPFRPQAPAGSVLERAIKECGHSRNQFVLTNLAMCQPVNDQLTNPRWFYSAIDNCKQYMDRVVEQYRPKCILALGAVPMQVLTGMTGKQSDNQTITHLRGYVLKGTRYPDIPVVSSFHPSFLRRGNMHLLPHLKRDLELAVAVAQSNKSAEEWWAQDKVDYNVNPTEFDLDDLYCKLVRNPSLRLDYDIETHDSRDGVEDELTGRPSTVLQIQFSIAPGTGMAVPFAGVWVEWARRLMALGNPKSNFNGWRFDNPVLRAGGTDAQGDKFEPFVINGRVDDVRDMWLRMQPDSPANLQYVSSFFGGPKHNIMAPWKHTSGQNLAVYGCRDVDVLGRIMARLPGQLRDRGCWDSYDKWTRPLRPVLDDCQARGVPFDTVALDQLHTEVEYAKDQVFAELQTKVPEPVKGRSPKVGYKVVPTAIKEALAEMGVGKESVSEVPWQAPETRVAFVEYVEAKTGFTLRDFDVPKTSLTKTEIMAQFGPEVDAATGADNGVAGIVPRWCKIEPFLPAGGAQVLRYIKHRKHPVPKVYGEDKETTNEESLQRLYNKTKDPVYKQILEYRSLLKIDSTYVKPFLAKLGPDGGVHTTFTFNPATGQLSSVEPNVQTTPVRKQIADSFRRCISARPGHVMLRFDYKSYHARTLGFEAQDLTYMKLASEDIHSFVAAHSLKLPDAEQMLSWSDADRVARLAEIKNLYPEARSKNKVIILSVGFGAGYRNIYQRNQEYFENEREAKQLVDMVQGVFPKVFSWQKRRRASLINGQPSFKGPYILTRWNFIRWFYDVGRWDFRRDKLEPGDDYNECVAFEPANDAFGMMRWNMLELERLGWLERARLCNTVHDDLWLETPLDVIDEAIPAIWKVLERPCPHLVDPKVGTFSCEVECQMGTNMGKFLSVEDARKKDMLPNLGGMQEVPRLDVTLN